MLPLISCLLDNFLKPKIALAEVIIRAFAIPGLSIVLTVLKCLKLQAIA